MELFGQCAENDDEHETHQEGGHGEADEGEGSDSVIEAGILSDGGDDADGEGNQDGDEGGQSHQCQRIPYPQAYQLSYGLLYVHLHGGTEVEGEDTVAFDDVEQVDADGLSNGIVMEVIDGLGGL